MKRTDLQAGHGQMPLDLGVEVQRDVNGIEMGVLENGVPFLTQRGLALVVGIARSVLQTITQEWEDHYEDDVLGKDRISTIKQMLFERGYTERKLYIETIKDGTPHYSYPDIVCMAILEYYAFETRSPNQQASDNYRRFATYGLQRFIYDSLGYTPADKWKYHNDRVSILNNSAPIGHFTIFSEINGLAVDLINADLPVNDKTIPDISVGLAWGKYWRENDLGVRFGARIEYEHNFPSYYPQAASNPQKPFAYPDAALPTFRNWFREEYLPTKFPKYILTKAKVLRGGTEEATAIANMYTQIKLPGRD
ncbi:hypothetical protein [Pseudomonas aeruginosa]|uniref:hypothetical protein n=1 Tax=Pseudomonas aeruginosa TaxID=287 RepID=UPI0010517582|nr:hypothetical protein [Pseudomonas aeruginosa]EKS3056061.1 hypothetical protein [Pseudomonas aeruginosa]MCO5375930.1 hypothetical protein [Pseudomonas aeruginosa]MCS8245269.1 hypothetical protein [Pseudomonas aeruginosa]MDU0550627.1 hypothetical protein [Pseudomonas aeruginosa]MDU0780941.1 hypothetical protein [Pseudomonas aeruginosa]